MDELITGTTGSGVAFTINVDRLVSVDDLRNVACLLHSLATKLEDEQYRDSVQADGSKS